MPQIPVKNNAADIPVGIAIIPIAALLLALITIMIVSGTDAISTWSPYALLGASALSLGLALPYGRCRRQHIMDGLQRSGRQILPAVPLLILIGLVSTTWMLGGIVPTLIDYGLQCLTPRVFLTASCVVCAVVSVLTGSSWTTIATIGVALTSIGTVLGFSPGWTAGAIISGAYFGDKVSPLSDTTVVASRSCDVELFGHIRYLMLTTVPAMAVALAVFTAAGFMMPTMSASTESALVDALRQTFNITPWVLLVPLFTVALIVCRVNTLVVLGASAAMGMACIIFAQPSISAELHMVEALLTSTTLNTGNAALDSLTSTGGVAGMLNTIILVLCAMVFGAAMIGTGMLSSLATAFTRRLTKRTSIVGTTVGSGLVLNGCTADQYLSLIIGANMFGDVYRRFGLEPRLLSRTLEDSISVTSVLIPWNSCGLTQAAVLGVSTFTYLPYCIFNIMSPVMSVLMAWTGYKVYRMMPARAKA